MTCDAQRIQKGDLVIVSPIENTLAVVLHEYLHKPWVLLRFSRGGKPQLYATEDLVLVSKATD